MTEEYEVPDDERTFDTGSEFEDVKPEDPQGESSRIVEVTPEMIDMEDDHNWTEGEQDDFYGMEDTIREIITHIGENPSREGLADTPARVLKAWKEIYGGYKVDIAAMMTTFNKEHYDEMVILKDIEFFSTCEHHMLPFVGVAHVAYIPDKRIVGLSKLARLVDAYARRMQNQERITTQVTAALEMCLQPKASACVIEAKHHCMGCRGVKKSGAVMKTSSLLGAFKDDPATRSELFTMLGK